MSKLGNVLLNFMVEMGGSSEALSAEEKRVMTWRNSAGQLVESRLHDRRNLEGIGQAHIDSYAAYHSEATPESCLQTAQSVAGMFSQVAKGAKILEDVTGGDGQYRFTVRTERGAALKLV